jgi:diguanylate cyclase (GGDEF)-like protein
MTGGTMVSLGMVFGGEGPASVATAFFFVWVALYVSWFFRTRTAVAHVVFDAAVFAAVLVIEQTPGGPAVWLLVMGTASVVSAVVTLMHRELVRVANRDLLTGLPTRPVLEETFAREAARAARHGLPLCVLILDVDGLKMINDRDGHSAGDRTLALAAQSWRSALRESDLLTRFGGDEFVAVLPNCSDSAADQLLARLQAATSIPHSAGIARWQPGDELADVLARADADLYRDKRLHYASAPIAKRTAPGQFSEGSMSAAVATGRLKR